MKNAVNIFKREFKSYFISPIAYIVISIFLILTGWFFFATFFLYGQAELRNFFGLLPLTFSFVIPAITMRLFSEELDIGSYELLSTLPVSSLDIVIGKFAAATVFTTIMLLPTVSYCIFISFIGQLDWGPIIGGYIGAILLGAAFSSIGLLSSSLTRNQIIAFITGMAVCFVLTLLDKILFFLPETALAVFQFLGADFHFQNISRGIIDSRDLLYFVSVCLVALYSTNLVMSRKKISKFPVYFVVIVLVNMASMGLFFRLDLTSNKIFSLSKPSKQVVSSLSEPLTVKAFFTGKVPAPYNNIERYLRDLLQEYSLHNNKYFNYQFFNVSGEEDEKAKKNQELASSYGIYPIQIQNIEKDEVKFQKAYMGLVLIHGNMIETIPTITSTEGLEFTITSKIQKMNNKISALLNLKEKVKVKLFLSSSLQVVGPYMNLTGLSEIPGAIENIVRKLNEKNFDKLEFANIDPTSNPSLIKEAEKNNILALQWDEFRDRTGRMISKNKGYAGIVVQYGGNAENIQLLQVFRLPLFGTQYQLSKMDEVEKSIDETVENVVNVNEEIGYLSGHGAPELGAMDFPLSNFSKLMSEGYTLKPVDLKKESVPEAMPSLIIAGAKEKFSDYELYQIDQYLMKGKSLAVFVDSFNEINQRSYLPINNGLEKLLAHYGVSVGKSYILDENCFKQNIPEAFGGGQQNLYFAPIIKNEFINKKVGFLKNIKGLVMLKASPIELDEERIKNNGLKVEKLFSSSERSWEISGNINLNPMFSSPPKEENKYKQMTMACVLDGSFPSYFADKPIPEKEEEKEEADKDDKHIDMSNVKSDEITIKKGKPGKVFVIGTSEILMDNVLDKNGAGPNAQFVMNVIDYLNNREAYAVMRSKSQGFNPIKDIKPDSKMLIKTTNIVGLPVLVVLAGLVVWLRRRSRQRVIQQIFR